MALPSNLPRFQVSQEDVDLLLSLNRQPAQMGGSSDTASNDTTNAKPNSGGGTPVSHFRPLARANSEGAGTQKAVARPVLRDQGNARAQATAIQALLARPQPQLLRNVEDTEEKYFEACRKELSDLIKFMRVRNIAPDPTLYLSQGKTSPSQDPAVQAYCSVRGYNRLGHLTSAILALREQPAQYKRRYDLAPADERNINVLIDALPKHPQRDEFQTKLRALSEILKKNGLTLDDLLNLNTEQIEGMLNREQYNSINVSEPVHMLKALRDMDSSETIQKRPSKVRIVLPPLFHRPYPSAPSSGALRRMEGDFPQRRASPFLPGLIGRTIPGWQHDIGLPFPPEPISPNNAAGRKGSEVAVENKESIIKSAPWSPSEAEMSTWSARVAAGALEIFISRASSPAFAKYIFSKCDARDWETWIRKFQTTEDGRGFQKETIEKGIQLRRAQLTQDRPADVEPVSVPLRRVF